METVSFSDELVRFRSRTDLYRRYSCFSLSLRCAPLSSLVVGLAAGFARRSCQGQGAQGQRRRNAECAPLQARRPWQRVSLTAEAMLAELSVLCAYCQIPSRAPVHSGTMFASYGEKPLFPKEHLSKPVQRVGHLSAEKNAKRLCTGEASETSFQRRSRLSMNFESSNQRIIAESVLRIRTHV